MYAADVKGQRLNFSVSGMLWQRSLVMLDQETKSLWSHILGECMQGELLGTRLETIPAEMLTWSTWKTRHPKTTVLKLSRTNRNYTRQFYKDPDRFVIGFIGNYGVQHVSMSTLHKTPVLNGDARGKPLLFLFDRKSTGTRIFERKLDDDVLTFRRTADGTLQDDKTSSIWSDDGIATSGKLKGRQLEPVVAIPSFKRTWLQFHAVSRELK